MTVNPCKYCGKWISNVLVDVCIECYMKLEEIEK